MYMSVQVATDKVQTADKDSVPLTVGDVTFA